jgi:hypothetical protein
VGWFEGSDEDGGCVAFGFGYRVEEAVNSVGEVDVGVAGRAEEDSGALGQADVGVAGGVVGLVALGLDDNPTATLVEERAADQIAGDVVDRSVKELKLQALQERSSWTRARTAARVSRASSIWRPSGAEPVPPAIRFDSSQLLRRSTS